MSHISVDTRDRTPIYEQLVQNIREGVLNGILRPGEQLPSVRSLSGELAINPNTIQKAYTELERQGIIFSLPGRGNFIAENLAAITADHKKKLALALTEQLQKAMQVGFTRTELEKMLDSVFGNDSDSSSEKNTVSGGLQK